MTYRYHIFFVPHIKDRRKISKLRSKVCKQVFSNQALQGPVHMSLTQSGFEIKNYSAFEKDLKNLCKKFKPMNFKVNSMSEVLSHRFWSGLHIKNSSTLTHLRTELQKVRNKHAKEKVKHQFHPPHITFAFPAIVKHLKPIKSPVKKLLFDRITIVRRENPLAPYRIYKHIKLS